jgi:signal transduction histidine kinase
MEELLGREDEILIIILIAVGLLVLMSLSIVLFFYFSRKKIIKTELEKANLRISYQKEVIQSTLIAQEEERKRIAQDMHDAISSKLNIVSLNANFLTEYGITSEDANKFGEGILSITATVLESSRRIAHDLLPPTLEKFGLQAALEGLCEEAGASKFFKIHSTLNYKENFLRKDEELHLFRIVQELFSNTIKYASASVIEISLVSDAVGAIFNYKDNGKGFEFSEAKKMKGLGLSGIENRASILDADLSIESSLGSGISVSVIVRKTQ